MNVVRFLGIAAVLFSNPLPAAQGTDPDWPCVQRKVEHLSLGVMWPDPVPEDAHLPDDLRGLAQQMALRRVSIEEVEQLIQEFIEERPDVDGGTYGLLYAEAFESIDRQRARIVNGITMYSRGQAGLAKEIDAMRAEFDTLEAAEEPDFDRLDTLEAEIDWRERVFDDRNASLTYVCEAPVLLERRAYEIARILLKYLN